MARILVADDEENIRKVLKGLLVKNGFTDVVIARDGTEAYELISDGGIDLAISDVNMPGMTGLELFEKTREMVPVFIILTAYGTVETAVAAMKKGVFDFIPKPFDEEELVAAVKKGLAGAQSSRLDLEGSGDVAKLFFESDNQAIKKIKETLSRAATARANMLITGETGTGKGLLASVVHSISPDKTAPFIKVNCAAIPQPLLEAELFGYVKGAFTGASTDKPGKFELADGGTIFLDEIGEMAVEMQAKLLAAIQDKEVTRLGAIKPAKTDVRVIAATNVNVKEAVKAKKFREDLYYRLNVIEFDLPPLRERRGDIPAFAACFLEKYAAEYSLQKKTLSPGAQACLQERSFPGNIRELENIMQKVTIMESAAEVSAEAIAAYLAPEGGACGGNGLAAAAGEKAKKEIELIKEAFSKTGNNRSKAAEMLGVSRRTLLYRLKEYGINP